MPDISFLVIMAVALGAMWLLTSRTRKQQKEAADFRANLAPGQEIMTGSGLFATIVDVEGEIITLETSPGVTSRWLRPAIAKLVPPTPADDEVEDEEYDEEYDEDEYDEELEATDDVEGADEAPLDVEIPDDASGLTTDGDDPRR